MNYEDAVDLAKTLSRRTGQTYVVTQAASGVWGECDVFPQSHPCASYAALFAVVRKAGQVEHTATRPIGTHAEHGCGGVVVYHSTGNAGIRLCRKCGQSSHKGWIHPVTGQTMRPQGPEIG